MTQLVTARQTSAPVNGMVAYTVLQHVMHVSYTIIASCQHFISVPDWQLTCMYIDKSFSSRECQWYAWNEINVEEVYIYYYVNI